MKRKLLPRELSGLLVLAVFVISLLAHRAGLFEFLEFRAYDFFLRQTPTLASGDPIVLIEIREDDILKLDYPLTDHALAELLTKLDADHPAVIGLDLWRDVPVPKSGEQLPELNKVLTDHTNIIGIYTIGAEGNKQPIEPPSALVDSPQRLSFDDNFLYDVRVEKTIPKVRRALLLTLHEGMRSDSFPFRVVCQYLARKGIEPEITSSEPEPFRFGKARIDPLRPNAGPYVHEDMAGVQILLDFKRPTNFVRFGIQETLAGKIPPGTLRDKIVVIGSNASSVSDERVTPIQYSHRGMELQSATILQLLRWVEHGEAPLRYPTDWLEDLWMLAWCLLGGLIGFEVRSTWRFVACILGALAVLALAADKAFELGYWIPLAAPAVAFLPAAGVVTSYVSFDEYRNRNQLMRLFSNQVSPDIAQALWEQRESFLAGGRPKSQQLTATVLFTDLKGFSTTSEGMTPSELMDWLNEYMEVMAQAVMEHKGVVEKYIGDSIMAVFGVPVPRTTPDQLAEDARNAVRCALSMSQHMRALNVVWKERALPVCSMRIGIHTGDLVAGSLGSRERQEYTVIGDSVNTASRLEGFDKDATDENLRDDNCRILISEATRRYLDNEFALVPVGSISLKGKSEKVTVYRVRAPAT